MQRIQTQRNLWLRGVLILTGILYAMLTCRVTEAQSTPTTRPVTLHFKQVPFRAALEELFRQAGVPYRLEPELETFLNDEFSSYEMKVTLDFKEVPFPRALDQLMRFNDGDNLSKPIGLMSYHQQNGVYVFSRGDGIKGQKITFNQMDTDLAEALQQVCTQVGVSYVLNLGEYSTHNVAFSALNMPFAEAVEKLLEAAHAGSALKLTIMNGVVIVGRTPLSYPFDDSLIVHPSQDKIVLFLQEENPYTALRAVCLSNGEAFYLSVAPELSRAKNLMQNASMEHVLKDLIRASKVPLKYSVDRKMVQIVEKHPSKEHLW